MKKLIVGFAAVGVVMALRPLVKQRVVQKMRDHCKEMMGGHGETTGHKAMAQKMREHCEGMAAQHREDAARVVAV
jgi:uncharacterized membrane protein YcjF (UPF0283 family)